MFPLIDADEWRAKWLTDLETLSQAAALDGVFDYSAATKTVRHLSIHFSDDEAVIDQILLALCGFAMPDPWRARLLAYAGAEVAKPGSIADQRLTEDWRIRSNELLAEYDLQKQLWLAACEAPQNSFLKRQGLEGYESLSRHFLALVQFANAQDRTNGDSLELRRDARQLTLKLADEFALHASYAKRQGSLAQDAEKRAALLFEETLKTLDSKTAFEKASAVVRGHDAALADNALRAMNEGFLQRSEVRDFSYELLRAAEKILSL